VSPLYAAEDFLDSRVGTLAAINNPRTVALTVQPGHRDQLPSNYVSRARACARARECRFGLGPGRERAMADMPIAEVILSIC
jgi:hypothetical protein